MTFIGDVIFALGELHEWFDKGAAKVFKDIAAAFPEFH